MRPQIWSSNTQRMQSAVVFLKHWSLKLALFHIFHFSYFSFHIFHLASKFSKDWAEIPNVTMRLTKLQFYLRKCLKAGGMMLPKTGKSGICNNVMLQICLTFILHIAIISRKTCCNPLLVLFHPKRAFFGFLGAQFSFFICTKIAIPN